MPMGDIITEVKKYHEGWRGGLPETPCGNGSKLSQTVEQRKWIPDLIRKYEIKTIADIGAGDLNWIKHTDLGDVEYTPYDLVPRHPDVVQFDLLAQVPPQVDMLMCLWVLNHFPAKHCVHAITNLLYSRSKYLLVTDRPRWVEDQPQEMLDLIESPLEVLWLNDKNDSIRLIELC
jgi:hypothetical protein